MESVKSKIYFPYIVCGYASLFALGLLDNARGPYYADFAADLKLPDSKASFLFVMTSLMAFFMGLIANWFIRKWNLLNLIRVGHLCMTGGFLCLAVMTNFLTLVLATTLFGTGFGLINVGENILIVDGTPVELRRKYISGLHSFYAMASILSPLVISIFIQNGLTWRHGFAWFSIAPLFSFALTFFAKIQKSAVVEEHHSQLKISWKIMLAGAALGFYVLAEILITSRLVVYLRRYDGMAPDLAAQVLALFFILVLAGRILVTFIDLRQFSSRKIMLICLGFSFLMNSLGLFWSPYWLVLCGLCMAPMFGIGVSYIAEIFPQDPSRAIANALSVNAIMIVIMHFTVGFVTQSSGIRTAMLAGPVFLLLAFVIFKLEPWKKDAT